MKVCVFQPPYSMHLEDSEACFRPRIDWLRQCDETVDLIVLPEYSDVPVRVATRKDTLELHDRYIGELFEAASETAKRCNAIVFVNALDETPTGYRNTTFAFDRNGKIVGKYYKRHLPPMELYTKALDHSYIDTFVEPYILELDGLRFAFLTCYDFYFYEAFSNIARQNVDIIIGCSLQRSDTHEALELMSRFCAYNCNAYMVRSSVSLGADSPLCGTSIIVSPDGTVLCNMGNDVGVGTAEFDPHQKYIKPAGFGNPVAPHYSYIEFGRRPWEYRPGGSAIVQPDETMPYPRVCAHRGFNTIAPENSLPAFGAAVAMGAEEIEFDLWATADGEIVSIHDATLDRVSDGTGKVYEKTYAELLQYDFGYRTGEAFCGMRILRFEEILQKFACHTVMNIHLKTVSDTSTYDRGTMGKIIHLIDKYDCRKYVYFMSGNDNVLALAQEMAPDIRRCSGESSTHWTIMERAKRYDCKKVQLFKPYFTQEMIDEAHALGMRCNVFWSDDPEEAKRFLAMGIDTILTNDYNAVAQAVSRK